MHMCFFDIVGNDHINFCKCTPSHHVVAQTLERILKERSAFKASPQVKLGSNLVGMVVDEDLNKVCVIDQVAGESLRCLLKSI